MKEWQKRKRNRWRGSCNPIACCMTFRFPGMPRHVYLDLWARPRTYTRVAPHFATQVSKQNSCISPPPPSAMHERNPYRQRKPDFAALADRDEALRPL